MKLNLATSTVRRVDDALTLHDLFDGRGFSFDFVVADLDGDHGSHVNHVSDRVYFIISGTGNVTVGCENYEVAKDDLVVIPKDTPHSISGSLRFLIITAPPFAPANEESLPNENDAEKLVEAFNDCINSRDIEGLSRLMTEDHVFIDAAGSTVSGRNSCVFVWKQFFVAFPDYYNHVDRFLTRGSDVVIVGHSICSEAILAGAALWKATVRGGLVSLWQVYDDTTANRALLCVDN